MKTELFTRLSPLIFIPLFLACGVEIYHNPPAPVDHYVSLTLSEASGQGRTLAQECIDLWDVAHGGTIDVDSPWLASDLQIGWENHSSDILIRISDAHGPVSKQSFAQDFFRRGGSTEMTIETAGTDYRVQLNGPYCNRLR